MPFQQWEALSDSVKTVGFFLSGRKRTYEVQAAYGLDVFTSQLKALVRNRSEESKKPVETGCNSVSTKSCEGKLSVSMPEEPVATLVSLCLFGCLIHFIHSPLSLTVLYILKTVLLKLLMILLKMEPLQIHLLHLFSSYQPVVLFSRLISSIKKKTGSG